MRQSYIMLAAAMGAGAMFQSCTDDDMPQPAASGDCAMAAESRSLDLGQEAGQGAFKLVNGFDPATPVELRQVTLPVTSGRDTIGTVDVDFNILPAYSRATSGDGGGDYYVIETSATVHNGAVYRQSGAILSGLTVRYELVRMSDYAPVTTAQFSQQPVPGTTLGGQNRHFVSPGDFRGTTAQLGPRLRIKRYEVGQGESLSPCPYVDYAQVTGGYCDALGTQHLVVEGSDIPKINLTEINGYGVYVMQVIKDGRILELPTRGYWSPSEIQGAEVRLYKLAETRQEAVGILQSGQMLDLRTMSPSDEFCVDGEGLDFGACRTILQIKPKIYEYRPAVKYMVSASAAFGRVWSTSTHIYQPDVATMLRTDTDATVEYEYSINNSDGRRGIPEVSVSDFNARSAWGWHVPPTGDAEDALYGVKVTVSAAYAADGGDGSRPGLPVKTLVVPLPAPERTAMCQIALRNTSCSVIKLGRLKARDISRSLSWYDYEDFDNRVISSGETAYILLPEGEYRIGFETIDPVTLKSSGRREIDVAPLVFDPYGGDNMVYCSTAEAHECDTTP